MEFKRIHTSERYSVFSIDEFTGTVVERRSEEGKLTIQFNPSLEGLTLTESSSEEFESIGNPAVEAGRIGTRPPHAPR